MFANKKKPLPASTIAPPLKHAETKATSVSADGIELGERIFWNPEKLPNQHILCIGASGSGKTQTLKKIAYSISKKYPTQVFIIDFHGDQSLDGETIYFLNMKSPHGVNPLTVDLDEEGGGPNLAAIAVATTMKKALRMGPNQEGALLGIFNECYENYGIFQNSAASWKAQPPTFADVEEVINSRVQKECVESKRLSLKLAPTFQYGIFNKPQPSLFSNKITRFDLSKLPPEIAAIAAESLAKQLLAHCRLRGEHDSKVPRIMLFVDEAKELKNSPSCDRIVQDGRKYGLGLALGSQSERHFTLELLANSSTKIVLPVDQTEILKVSKKFRFGETRLAALNPLEALVRLGTEAHACRIIPYFEVIQ